MSRKILMLICVLFAGANLFAQNQKVTLDDCVRLSLESSDEVKIGQSKIDESKAKISEITSQYLPQLKFSAGYSRLSSVDPFLVTVPNSPVPFKIADALFNNYSLRLSATQLVFTGFRLGALENIAGYGKEISGVDYDETKNNVAFEALSGYWNLYKAMLSAQIAEQSILQTERRITDTKNFILGGLSTNTDLLRLEVQNSNAKLQLLEAENNISNARVALNRLLGYSYDTPVEPDTSAVVPEDLLIDEAAYVAEALLNRNELKNLNYAIQSSDEYIRVAKSSYYPYVSLFGNVYYSNPNARVQPPKDEFTATWDVGIGLTWDLWNWGLTSSQTEQARQVQMQNTFKLDLAKKKIEQEVRQKFGNADYLKKRIDASLLSVELARKNYDEVVKKYDVQLSSSTEVADAETSLFIARRNYAFALIDYRLAMLALHKAAGRRLY